MATRRVDRRLARTRSSLQKAFIELIQEKGYDATTVQDIIDRANVGRSTFYAHFPDKETLLMSGIEDLRAHLTERQRASRALHPNLAFGFSLAMLEHARGHWRLYKAQAGHRTGYIVVQRITEMLTDVARAELPRGASKEQRQNNDLAAQFVAGGLMSLIKWWLEKAPDLTEKAIDQKFRLLVVAGLSRFT